MSALPPYVGIDPELAATQLDAPAGTEDFARIASACAAGRQDLESRGLEENGNRSLRLFSTWEITRYLIPVAAAHLRRVLKANPDLPQGEGEAGAKWFTLEEVMEIRDHFATEGASGKAYKSWRPEGLPAKVVAVANFKGGVGKTSTAAHLAMSAALDGYKVLMVDLDSQGSLSSIFGAQIEDEWQTVFPLLARHYAETLRIDNQRRIDRGDPPIAVEDALNEALKLDGDAASDGETIRESGEPVRLAHAVDAEQADCLEVDATGPALAHRLEHRPGDRLLRRNRIKMGAYRLGSVGECAFQRELHARLDIFRRPVGRPVGQHRAQRARKRPVGIGPARPDVTLVEMRVAIDERRKDDAAAQIVLRALTRCDGRCNGGDTPILDGQIV